MRRLRLIAKVSIALTLIISAFSTGFMSTMNKTMLDIAESASASTQQYTVNAEITYDGAPGSGYVLETFKTGDKFSFMIDYADNTINNTKLNWSFGGIYGSSGGDGSYKSNDRMFISGIKNIASIIPGYSDRWTDNLMLFTSSKATFNSVGKEVFDFDVVAGGSVTFTQIIKSADGSYRGPVTGYMRILSKVQGSSGGSCGSSSSSQQYTVNAEITYDGTPGAGYVTESFKTGDKFSFVIDYSDNTINNTKLNWSFGGIYGSSGGDGSYKSNDRMFISGIKNISSVIPGYSDRWTDNLMLFTSSKATFNSMGKEVLDSDITAGGSVTFTQIIKSADGSYRGPASGYMSILSKVMGGGTSSSSCGSTPAPPSEISCPSGTSKIGSGSSAYCQKVVTNYVKQTEKEIVDLSSLGLDKIIEGLKNGQYGGSGDRGDGQFQNDDGTHSNGWLLDGSGKGKTNNFVNFTNIPDNGAVNALGESWSPELLISQGKVQLPVPHKDTGSPVDKQQWDKDLNSFIASGSKVDVISYEVSNLKDLEDIQARDGGLSNFFNRDSTGSGYEYSVQSLSIKNNVADDIKDFKMNKSGYYILGTKYTDLVSAKEKHGNSPTAEQLKEFTYYTFVPISLSFMSDLGYLPIYNNLLSQVNESILLVGNKKANHSLTNLKYGSYKSMKVPSAYNHNTGKTLVASTNGGVQLLNDSLTAINIKGAIASDATTVVVNDILSHESGFYIATKQGVLFLDCETDELIATTVTGNVNDLELYYDNLYLITDNELSHYFIDGTDLVASKKNYKLDTMFKNPANKASRIEIVGNLLTVSTKDEGSGSEVLILTKL